MSGNLPQDFCYDFAAWCSGHHLFDHRLACFSRIDHRLGGYAWMRMSCLQAMVSEHPRGEPYRSQLTL